MMKFKKGDEVCIGSTGLQGTVAADVIQGDYVEIEVHPAVFDELDRVAVSALFPLTIRASR